MMGQQWPDCDKPVKDFVFRICKSVKAILGSNLSAVYLHGSLATGSFYPPKSDLDLLILVHRKLDTDTQKILHKVFFDLNAGRPITGAIELSILLTNAAKHPVHPVFYELHYGENYNAMIRDGIFDYAGPRKGDPDLAAHLTVARAFGVPLYGPPTQETLGEVPWVDFMHAVLGDLKWILEEENILISPFYSVLNACRILQLLKTGEMIVANKEEGAQWALDNLPLAHHKIINSALTCYRDTVPSRPMSAVPEDRHGIHRPCWRSGTLCDQRQKFHRSSPLKSKNRLARHAQL
jgi:predicted nucleotidyltransferase